MNWYLQRGKDSDVVVNCKIMYSRNLRNHRFNTKNETEIQEIENEVRSKIQGLGYNLKFIKIKDLDELTKMSMLEKGLIDETAIKNENVSALINDDENICILLNSQDHIEIQVFNSGMELEGTFNLAKEIDNKFDKTFCIAKSKKYGYLTSSPLNVGTGLKAEITVHLGVIKELSDDDVAKIYFYMEPSNLQKYFNKNLDGYDRDIKRGEMIRNIIKEGSV